MRPKRDVVPRAERAWNWLGGIFLLGLVGAGVAAAAVVLWENVDIRRISPDLAVASGIATTEPEPAAAAARRGAGFEAVVLVSPRNASFFPDPAFYPGEIAAWQDLLAGMGATTRTVTDADGLAAIAPSDVLVVPHAACLSVDELAAIEAHLQEGGGVLATWAIGARDEACEWTGWQTVAGLTGAEDVREIPGGESLYLSVPGGVALSPGLDPGTRIEVVPDASLALRVSGPRVYWSDWALNPRVDESGGGADVAAVATWSPLGGRISWMGFRLGQAATPADSTRLSLMARNAVAWVAGEPTAAIAPWPGARRSATVFVLDVEAEPENATATADMLRARGVPGTFFVVSGLVDELGSLAATLVNSGEVGSQTVDHAPLVDRTAQDQRARLRRSAADLRSWAGVAPVGLHPPREAFDSVTIDAWQQAGGSYLVASNERRSASPELHRSESGTLVLLPRVLKDDYNIIVQDRVLRAEGLRDALLAEAEKAHAVGGLGIVAGHTQILRPGARVEALAEVVDSIAADEDRWVATGREVASWWRARNATRISFDPPYPAGDVPPAPTLGPGVEPASTALSDLFVTAPGGTPLGGLWVDVVVAEVPAEIVPLVNGEPVDFEMTRWGLRIPVGDLDAGETRRISFVLAPGGSGGTDSVRSASGPGA
jgi:peptidoglycan/xylan/chitin deacetylase (PgdA/CDA1 family)